MINIIYDAFYIMYILKKELLGCTDTVDGWNVGMRDTTVKDCVQIFDLRNCH